MAINYFNPNTPSMWDKNLFGNNQELLNSPFYVDKINKVSNFLFGKTGKFLDFGLGLGNLVDKLISQRTRLDIYGVDFSSKAIANARKKFRGQFLLTDLKKVPFEKSSFDYVAALDVLEHFDQKEVKSVLSEIKRITKRDGYLIISVPLNEKL